MSPWRRTRDTPAWGGFLLLSLPLRCLCGPSCLGELQTLPLLSKGAALLDEPLVLARAPGRSQLPCDEGAPGALQGWVSG